MKARVTLTVTAEVLYDQKALDAIMAQDWQDSFYHFSDQNEALVWLATVLQQWEPDSVDGLYGLGVASRVVETDGEVDSVSP